MTTTTIVIIIIIIIIIIIVITIMMIMMMMIIKIIIGGHRGLICIYLKCMHEVKLLVSSSLRDIHNWNKEKRII